MKQSPHYAYCLSSHCQIWILLLLRFLITVCEGITLQLFVLCLVRATCSNLITKVSVVCDTLHVVLILHVASWYWLTVSWSPKSCGSFCWATPMQWNNCSPAGWATGIQVKFSIIMFWAEKGGKLNWMWRCLFSVWKSFFQTEWFSQNILFYFLGKFIQLGHVNWR